MRISRAKTAAFSFFTIMRVKEGWRWTSKNPRGKQVFLQLCEKADLLLESFVPGYLDSLGISYDRLSAINPRLVQTSITPFGNFGPYRNLAGSDLICSAMGGFLHLAGIDDEKPVRACDNQAYRMAEAYAAVGSSIALLFAKKTGIGQFVDVACLEAAGMALENAAQYWDLEGVIRRGRGKVAGEATIHPCKDGYFAIVAIMGRNKVMWDPFVNWMKEEGVEQWEVFDNDKWIDADYRSTKEGYETFCRIFEKFTMQHDKLTLYEKGQANKVALTPVSNGKDLLENPQLRHRNYWKSSIIPTLARRSLIPARLTSWEISSGGSETLHPPRGNTAPRYYENSATRKATSSPLQRRVSSMSANFKKALEGIVVCDFSWVGAGPIATNVLGQCGAEIIKIESKTRPDILRKGGPFKDGNSQGLERSGYFANRNPNKKCIALNMSLPEARDVAVRLIKESDIIINNFRVGQMEKWKLGWEDVKEINPRIIYITMSLQGLTGPHKSYMGYGVNLNALCGLTERSAFKDGRPLAQAPTIPTM